MLDRTCGLQWGVKSDFVRSGCAHTHGMSRGRSRAADLIMSTTTVHEAVSCAGSSWDESLGGEALGGEHRGRQSCFTGTENLRGGNGGVTRENWSRMTIWRRRSGVVTL